MLGGGLGGKILGGGGGGGRFSKSSSVVICMVVEGVTTSVSTSSLSSKLIDEGSLIGLVCGIELVLFTADGCDIEEGDGGRFERPLAKLVDALGGRIGKGEPELEVMGLELDKLGSGCDVRADSNQSGSLGRTVGLGGITAGTEEGLD